MHRYDIKGVNCRSAEIEVVAGNLLLLQLENILEETEPICRIDMQSFETLIKDVPVQK